MPFKRVPKHAALLIIAALCIAAASGCDQSDSAKAPAAEQEKAQEPSQPKGQVPDEFRDQFQAELAEARTLALELRDGTQKQPEGSGTEALQQALAPFASLEASAFGENFYASLRDGKKPPAQVAQMVERRRDELEALSNALAHRTFKPDIPVGADAAGAKPATASVIQAAKLLAASGGLAGPEKCLERATDILRLAMASSYGQGYMGAMQQSAVAGIGRATATGCGEDASEQAASNTAAHIEWLIEGRPGLTSTVYFEMLRQIPKIGQIVSGEVEDAEISKEQARESIAFRLELLPKLRALTAAPSYEMRRQKLESLLNTDKDPLLKLQEGFFPRVARQDAQLHRDLESLSTWLDARSAASP